MGCLGVYARDEITENEIFLGFFVQFGNMNVLVFNPEIFATFYVNLGPSPYIDPIQMDSLSFESSNCTTTEPGEPVYKPMGGLANQLQLYYDPYNDDYYVADNTISPFHSPHDPDPRLNSTRTLETGYCQGWTGDNLFMALQPIDFPLAHVPLAHPIVVRPIE